MTLIWPKTQIISFAITVQMCWAHHLQAVTKVHGASRMGQGRIKGTDPSHWGTDKRDQIPFWQSLRQPQDELLLSGASEGLTGGFFFITRWEQLVKSWKYQQKNILKSTSLKLHLSPPQNKKIRDYANEELGNLQYCKETGGTKFERRLASDTVILEYACSIKV